MLKIVGLIDFSDQRSTHFFLMKFFCFHQPIYQLKVKLIKLQLEKNVLHEAFVLFFPKVKTQGGKLRPFVSRNF